MRKFSTPVIIGFIVGTVLLGAFAGLAPRMAAAQNNGQDAEANGEKPAESTIDARALFETPKVVAAFPYQSVTDYEQDPFEPARLRRTQTNVVRILIVKSDGSTEIKQVQ